MMPATPPDFTFNRAASLARMLEVSHWDLIVIGGGATGLGIAVDGATRGMKTLLLEQSDFAKGTSSRSTKLVHGGVRYLAQGNIKLVFEALRERGYLLRNAPHLVKKLSFVIPCYSQLALAKYWTGLKLYDWLSGGFSFGASEYLDPRQVAAALPGIKTEGLIGGVRYYDGQFDDARLAVNLAQTAALQGASVLNYMRVTSLLKRDGKVCGVSAHDVVTGMQYQLHGTIVVNATGVFVDELLKLDVPEAKPLVRPSQGIHLVLPAGFLPAAAALMIPQTTDGRVLFALPWHDHLLVGTTDTPLEANSLEPVALNAEVDFVLENLKQYLTRKPARADVLSVFAGLRPLVAGGGDEVATKAIARDHKLFAAASGLITITGGKWTTYRKMAEDTVNLAVQVGSFVSVPCTTRQLKVHGCSREEMPEHWGIYGADAPAIRSMIAADAALGHPLVAGHPYTAAEVIWAVRNEMAETVEDVLARRLRLLFLDAAAALKAAPEVARIMAAEKRKDDQWIAAQLAGFAAVAAGYFPVGRTSVAAPASGEKDNALVY